MNVSSVACVTTLLRPPLRAHLNELFSTGSSAAAHPALCCVFPTIQLP